MKIFAVCKNCQQKIKVKGIYPTRIDIAMEKGEEIELICPFCKEKGEYKVDNINAEEDGRNTIFFILLFPLIGLILWFLYPFVVKSGIKAAFILPAGIAIPILLYTVISRNRTNKVKIFNSTFVESRAISVNLKAKRPKARDNKYPIMRK
ncbi:MAG: hypothetical protein FWH36_02885 [Lentimicrobiaceae bacterium]|nr:hypothetical protein [Lentimicrobiaceae bacterium]